jgi:hypothetical protein
VPCRVYFVNANRSPEEIHEEICTILSQHNELFVSDNPGDQVQKESRRGREVSCSPFPNVCRVS